jgi:hypothetical protein
METRLHHHTRRLIVLVLILLVGLVQLQLPAAHAQTHSLPIMPTPYLPVHTPVKFKATLNGAQVTPGPGDPTGQGEFTFIVNGPPVNTVDISGYFYNLSSKFAGAHVHVYDANGNPLMVRYVRMLSTQVQDGTWVGSGEDQWASPYAVDALTSNPKRVKVDVHSVLHPDGAIAGGLYRASPPPIVIDE